MSSLKPFVLALDVGTSSLKAVVYAFDGNILASESSSYEYNSPQPGWAEASPADWQFAMEECLARLSQTADLLQQIEVIAFTGQMHTAVLLDQNLKPLEPTILWLDRRAAIETSELQAALQMPPHQLNSTYTLPKLYWMNKHLPGVIQKARHILWPKDYLRFLLTGEIYTDITEPGGAALLNWETLDWATDRLAFIGIDPKILPPILQPEDEAGTLLPQVVERFKLNPLTKVIAGAGDVLALISSAPPAKGRLNCSLGSSSMIFCPLEPHEILVDPFNRIYTYPLLRVPMLGGVSSTTGAALQWAWKNLYPDTTYEIAIEEALKIPAGSEGVFFLPFLSGERSPFWNDHLRGSFQGLSLSHSRAHLLRAVMEGVGFSLLYMIHIFQELNVNINEIALAGGGTRTQGWAQIISDISQLPVCVYTGQETVTHALFAYACLATQTEHSFEQALLATFDDPAWIYPRKELAGTYYSIFNSYKTQTAFQMKLSIIK
ncbi:MAG: FGGY family carbohydrate kinase [Anaerolineaceae bacterium]|jgi:xylulokinase|nr:FGGY family carbohydrate kinase [Anaerolineaceae bacterium]